MHQLFATITVDPVVSRAGVLSGESLKTAVLMIGSPPHDDNLREV